MIHSRLRIVRAAGWGLAGTLILSAVIFGYGITAKDARELREFDGAVDRWQVGPEFREVGADYVRQSVAAMQARVAGVSACDVVMLLRSIPGLPEEYAANAGSRKHYEDFTRGDLSAYLHLCGEQGIGDVLPQLETLARGKITDEDVRGFLRSFKMPLPVPQDAGALASVRRLLADTQAAKGFSVRAPVDWLLRRHAEALAQRHGWVPKVERLSSAKQAALMGELDAEVRSTDYELWRTKQVNDFLAGVWGQGYGLMYRSLISDVLRMRAACRVIGPGGVLVLVGLIAWRRARARERQGRGTLAAAPGTLSAEPCTAIEPK
jgi:hypothetical protein